MQLNDLPDEILLLILKELHNCEVLYSFHDVNQRFNRVIHDPIFTSRLNFVKWSCHKIVNKFSSNFIDQFSLQILPEICKRIKWFNLESSFMTHFLSANKYPDLCGLGLYNVDEETINFLFTDNNLSSDIFKNQITSLVVGIDSEKKNLSTVENICNNLFTMMNNLIHLTFYDTSYRNIVRFMTDVPSSKFSSSTLLTLNIKAHNFDDFLYILDGRFNNLQSLYIDLIKICFSSKQIKNQGKIPNLKCFNLSCFLETWNYNTLIVPLLHRMLNLEKLGLYIMTYVKERFIDGNSLKEDILHHLTKIKHFDFDIYSYIYMKNQLNFPSKEDIQQTFKDFPCTKVISCVDYIHKRKQAQCHVYSYPFLMEFYEQITNNFPGGFYPYVRIVSLYDEHPFEHEFFLQISLAFPLMGRLTLFNYCSQNVKQSIDINQNFEIIRYYHLIELDIRQCHDDYTEEFLLHTKTYLHNSISLDIDLESLARITQNFTRNETRINCSKVNELFLYGESENLIQSLQNYFPFAEID
ncbi:unnamed protein product [Rotaria sp. Silwood1]|nr:unnamed protein product [Rotaria sp. Silwood1]